MEPLGISRVFPENVKGFDKEVGTCWYFMTPWVLMTHL